MRRGGKAGSKAVLSETEEGRVLPTEAATVAVLETAAAEKEAEEKKLSDKIAKEAAEKKAQDEALKKETELYAAKEKKKQEETEKRRIEDQKKYD